MQTLAATVAETKAKLEERESEYLAELNTVKTGIAEFKNEVKPLKAFVDKHGEKIKTMKSYAEIDQEIKAVKGESGQNSEELAAVTSIRGDEQFAPDQG